MTRITTNLSLLAGKIKIEPLFRENAAPLIQPYL
jgi:hypothetical protein